MTRRSFETSLAKGELGEEVVRELLESRGWVVYQPVTSGPHHFDMLCIKDKKRAIAFDVKAKARMNWLPCTGVNQKHFEEYQQFSERHRMPFWLVFVDEALRQIYGNTLDELEKPREVEGRSFPMLMETKSGVRLRLWPLVAMRQIASITDSHAAALTAHSQRSYEYEVRA